MTSPLRSDWDDERLVAAFAARADADSATPTDLAEAVVERLAGRPRPSIFTVRRAAPALGAAAAIALAIIVGGGQLLKAGPAASLAPTSTGLSAPKPSSAAS